MDRKVIFTTIALALSLLLVVLGLFAINSDNSFGDRPSSISELGGDFTLQHHEGEVSLSDFTDKVVVMYFGFTSCPEVCPNSMGVISAAFNRMDQASQDQVQGLLVSLDPSRDSLANLAEYAEFYHHKIIGLTGSQDSITAVTNQYGAYYDFADISRAGEDYAIEHSSRYYVIDQQGRLVAAMRHSTTPNELKTQIEELLETS
ncbi:MAG: SCO family protein [Pseudomonadota bacterium]